MVDEQLYYSKHKLEYLITSSNDNRLNDALILKKIKQMRLSKLK